MNVGMSTSFNWPIIVGVNNWCISVNNNRNHHNCKNQDGVNDDDEIFIGHRHIGM